MTALSFARSKPTLRGGFFSRGMSDAMRKRYNELFRLRETLEDSDVKSISKFMLIRKLRACINDEVSKPLEQKIIETTHSLLRP